MDWNYDRCRKVALEIAVLLQPFTAPGLFNVVVDLAINNARHLCALRRVSGRKSREIVAILNRYHNLTLEDLHRHYELWGEFPKGQKNVRISKR